MRNRIAYQNLRRCSTIEYGRLYNWPAAAHANIAPVGWSVPSPANFTTLFDYINNTFNVAPDDYGVGNHLKHRRKNGTPVVTGFNTSTNPRWNAHGTHYGRDTVYFGGIAGGLYNNGFSVINQYGYFYTKTTASYRQLAFDGNTFTSYTAIGAETLGLSIRCFRSASTAEQEASDGRHMGQVMDIDGNVYDTVKIGTQIWMVENLATTRLNDGTEITLVTSGAMSNSVPNYANYNNDTANVFFASHNDSIWKPNDFVI